MAFVTLTRNLTSKPAGKPAGKPASKPASARARLAFLGLLLASLGAGLLLTAPVARAGDDVAVTRIAKTEDPGATVSLLAEQALAVLLDSSLARHERLDAFRDLLNQGFDLDAIGSFVLGRYNRQASDAERQEFRDLFEAFLIASYVSKLDAYNGESLEVLAWNSEESGHALVSSKLRLPSGEPIRVEWRMRESGDSWRIVDVVIEGVSLAVTMRSEFTSVIRSQGGMTALLDRLRRVVATTG